MHERRGLLKDGNIVHFLPEGEGFGKGRDEERREKVGRQDGCRTRRRAWRGMKGAVRGRSEEIQCPGSGEGRRTERGGTTES